MIYSIKGHIINFQKQENNHFVALEGKSGVCFNLRVSSFTAEKCKVLGSELRLFVHLVVRENGLELFGFHNELEKDVFKLLISVSGVGPSFAISVLSDIEPVRLIGLINEGNEKALCCCKGIGKKTASRIVLELKSKISKINFDGLKINFVGSGVNDFSNDSFNEAISALVVLGYDKSKAKKAIYSQSKDYSVEQLVKNALKILS